MAATQVKVGSRSLSVSNLDKVMYPKTGFTKGDVIHYYTSVAKAILSHLKNHPLTLKRYPNGVDGMFFYEKRAPSHRPAWVKTARMESKSTPIDFTLANDLPTLVWVANLASIELHTLLSKAPNLSKPTMAVFDLDPGPPAGVLDACRISLRMRDLFTSLKLKSFVKHSGGKGLHIVVPLNSNVTFDQTKAFARSVALHFEKEFPGEVLHLMRKNLRAGKVFIDWSQNDIHKTTVCAYSLRAREQEWVSAPLTWQEVETAVKKRNADPIHFTAKDVINRVQKLGDLFAPALNMKQKLPESLG